jgi:hypothetical protein
LVKGGRTMGRWQRDKVLGTWWRFRRQRCEMEWSEVLEQWSIGVLACGVGKSRRMKDPEYVRR